MDAEDAEKIEFITNIWVFYYKVMSFGLKNIGATYQGLISGIFKDMMGLTVEVYVDNMVVKSRSLEDHLEDIQKVYNVLTRQVWNLTVKSALLDKSGDIFRVHNFRERYRSKPRKN